MNLPIQMNLNNKLYDTLSLVTINQSKFLVVRSGFEVIYIDTKEIEGQLAFSMALDLNDTNDFSEHILIEFLLEALRLQIKNNNLENGKLSEMLTGTNEYIKNSDIMPILTASNEHIKEGNVQFNVISLIEFLNKKMSALTFLNIESLNEFQINKQPYLKWTDKSGKVVIMLDSLENRNLRNNDGNEQKEPVNIVNEGPVFEPINAPVLEMVPEEVLPTAVTIDTTEGLSTVASESLEESGGTSKVLVRKNAAFADTLIISFVVGIICGIYLTYLVLAIL